MLHRVRRPPARWFAGALAAGLLLVVGVACSGKDDDAGKSLSDLGISDTPSEVVTIAIERIDANQVLGADVNARYLRLRYAVRGYSWTDAECAVGKVIDVVTPAAFEKMPVGRLENIKYDYPTSESEARTCASPETVARLDAEADRTVAVATRAAPDIDGEAVGSILEDFYRAGARQIDLTGPETECVIDAILSPLTPEDFVEVITGAQQISVEDTAPKVVTCLGADRIAELAPDAGASLLAQKKQAQAEHDRIQEKINAQIDELSSSTTSP